MSICWHLARLRGGEPLRLPLPDASASAVAEAVLAPNDPHCLEGLRQALSVDPPLALWAACGATSSDPNQPPSSLERLSGELAAVCPPLQRIESADGARWSAGDAAEKTQHKPGSPRDLAKLAAGSVRIAMIAARLAEPLGREAKDRAYLLGLCSDWQAWLKRSGTRNLDALPEWLGSMPVDDHRVGPWQPESAVGCVIQAKRLLQASRHRDRLPVTADELRRRMADVRRWWLADVRGAGRRLAELSGVLTHLRSLESGFDTRLEAQRLEAMAELAAGAGHEINNPLAVISGRAQLLLHDEADPERRRVLASIHAQAMRVYEMIADMMLFARPPEPQPETLDIETVIERVVQEVSSHATERGIRLQSQLVGPSLTARVDPSQLAVALKAVLDNAIEAIDQAGVIEVLSRKSSSPRPEEKGGRGDDESPPEGLIEAAGNSVEMIEIIVRDDGPGLSDEVRQHAFDPFYSGRAAGRGLGMGLSKCWRIVTQHGGRVSVDNRPGGGAEFTLAFPVSGPGSPN